MTASVLAGELGLALLQVRLDGLITRFMGETAAKLRQIFDATHRTRGIYFFDEFDAIGSGRILTNDVGEIRRVLNSFLLMIEQDHSHSLVVAASNHPDILDRALFRRFDDLLQFNLPDAKQAARLLRSRLQSKSARVCWKALGEEAHGLSYAEITRAANDVLKDALCGRTTTRRFPKATSNHSRANSGYRSGATARPPLEPSGNVPLHSVCRYHRGNCSSRNARSSSPAPPLPPFSSPSRP